MFGFTKNTDAYNGRQSSIFNGFTVGSCFSGGRNVLGIPKDGLMAWWNPEVGIVTSSGRVVTWTDVSGNYTLRPTAFSSTVIIGPQYVTDVNSAFNNKPYINFDTSAGQKRNLSQSSPVDENWLNITPDGGYTFVYACNFQEAIGQNTPFFTSNGMSMYYDNSIFLKAYGNGVAYASFLSIPSPTLNSINVHSISSDLKNGRWWYSTNGSFQSVIGTTGTVDRNNANATNILRFLNGGVAGLNGGGTKIFLYDIVV